MTPKEQSSVKPVLLIGAQKSGSSYLFHLLAQNPAIATADLKEPRIFSRPMCDSDNFLSYFRLENTHRYALDGSTSYLHVAGTAEQVAERLSVDVPILAVLRNPAERAISGYLHEVKHGRELRRPEEVFDLPHDNISEAIAAENFSIHKAWHAGQIQPHNAPEARYRDQFFQFRYIANSHYSAQLAPWTNLFDNVRLIDFRKLQNDPEAALRSVHLFLRIDESERHDLVKDRNSTKLRNWQALKQNRRLHFDHGRPTLISVMWKQYTLFSSLRMNKPVLGPELTRLLDDAFWDLQKMEHAAWM